MSGSHPFDAALALEPLPDGTYRGRTEPAWQNMVGPFGGITAAVLLRAAERHPDRAGEPLALTVNYLAPIVDGDFEINARPVRTNRTNQHWMLELAQPDGVKTTASAVFGLHRETWADTEPARPAVPEPEALPAPNTETMIQWMHNYETRFAAGPFPEPGDGPSPSSTTTQWVRDRRGRHIDYAALTALCDIFYPRIFLRYGQFTPAGTISVTMYFHASVAELAAVGDDFVLGTARANRFSGGYFDQSAQLWSRSGELLATTEQLVYFKG